MVIKRAIRTRHTHAQSSIDPLVLTRTYAQMHVAAEIHFANDWI